MAKKSTYESKDDGNVSETKFSVVDPAALKVKQVYQENEHENPFDVVWNAAILELRKSTISGDVYVKYERFRTNRPERKEPMETATEADFRNLFPNLKA